MSVLVSTLQGHKNTIYMGIPYECPSVILAWSQVQKNRMFVHKWPLWPYAEAAVYSYEQHVHLLTFTKKTYLVEIIRVNIYFFLEFYRLLEFHCR